jgi:hypothetical protein
VPIKRKTTVSDLATIFLGKILINKFRLILFLLYDKKLYLIVNLLNKKLDKIKKFFQNIFVFNYLA